eukprot:3739336-Amphidinium_carterae.1
MPPPCSSSTSFCAPSDDRNGSPVYCVQTCMSTQACKGGRKQCSPLFFPNLKRQNGQLLRQRLFMV